MKQVVHYDQSKGVQFVNWGGGEVGFVWPIDHPDTLNVSNKHVAQTSRVVKKHEDGSFETLNSHYIPKVRA